ncbi:MAG TPA: LeuA family protein [Vicinamibacterales bacterium]|jgi:2-isopropylmalate synthase|nr:LeuA family protein [Vicinamibacterales bacterium]
MIDSLIFDWNRIGAPDRPPLVMLDDETLRDGLQSPSVRTPSIDQKIHILHLIDALGIDTADIGLPGAGPHVMRDVERLAREIVSAGLSLRANCAARTHVQDIKPIAEIVQRTGLPIECCTFIGSSPIRQFTEGWTLEWLLRSTEEAITFAVKEGLDVMYVTEDTTRANPETLRAIYTCAIRAGAKRICVADTVGHATPAGASAVVRFAGQVIREAGAEVGIDWHGHRDRDLAIINSIAALEAGATRVHGTALGIGERVGNTPMDLLLVNLVLMGYIERDLHHLEDYCHSVSDACRVPIPENYPVIGRDAFRTATGVHAAAVVKAWKKGDRELMDSVYSGIPASLVGREQVIEVGPMSGKSNVTFWLEKRGITASEQVVDRVFQRAKSSRTVLTEAEILAEVYR